VDASGREHDGDALIEKAVATFDTAKHEPPIVIGHPADNTPAFGWVAGLKKQGDLLLAKFKQVQPEFEDMVRRGLFKKRSAAFYNDGSLRHVGFLGAMPPAVKGLADVAFSEGEAVSFEFSEDIRAAPAGADPSTAITTHSETRKEEKSMKFEEFIQKLKSLIGEAGTQVADPSAGKTFSEVDIETARKQAADEAARQEREKLTAEFAERERTARQAARKAEIFSWCESMVKAGKMTPAWVKYGVPDMMLAFSGMEGEIEFGEGDGKVKATLYDRFKTFFETEMPKVIEFKEIATRDKDTGGQGDAGNKLEALVAKKRETDKNLTYSAAFAEVQRENPDLAREYHQEIGG
jgi:hypothetical protein